MTNDEIVDMCATDQGDQWRHWYAWRPVWLDQEHRPTWLRWVWRRDVELGWGCSAHQRRLSDPRKTPA